MKKINTIDWFEIPVKDMIRAKKFYENVFQIELKKVDMPDSEMLMFPGHEDDHYGAMGALIFDKNRKPGIDGSTVYFYCKNLDNELSRIEKNGGKITVPKTNIGENGFFAYFLDSEGNLIALHSYPIKS